MTDTTDIKAELHCSGCGGNLFERPADPQADDVVVCGGCRREWRYADLRQAAREKALDAFQKLMRDTLKNSGIK